MNAFDEEAPTQRKGQIRSGENTQLISQIQKPSSFIILVLIAVIMMLACQFGQLQHQIEHMSKQLKSVEKEVITEKKEGTQMISKMKGIDKKIDRIEKEEKTLKKKEHEIEDKEKMLIDHDNAHRKHIEKIEKKENWGEGSHEHVIKMTPLIPFGGHHSPKSPAEALTGLGKAMENLFKNIAKPGKAPEHKKGPFLPHSITKPGAHPQHNKKDDKHKDDKHKKDDKDTKMDKKAKSEQLKEEYISKGKNQELKKPVKIN